jgi:putative zinc finger protein
MKCIEAIDLMSDSIEMEITDKARSMFDRHLSGCRSCSLYLSQVRVTIELCASLGEASKPPADLYRTLLARASA